VPAGRHPLRDRAQGAAHPTPDPDGRVEHAVVNDDGRLGSAPLPRPPQLRFKGRARVHPIERRVFGRDKYIRDPKPEGGRNRVTDTGEEAAGAIGSQIVQRQERPGELGPQRHVFVEPGTVHRHRDVPGQRARHLHEVPGRRRGVRQPDEHEPEDAVPVYREWEDEHAADALGNEVALDDAADVGEHDGTRHPVRSPRSGDTSQGARREPAEVTGLGKGHASLHQRAVLRTVTLEKMDRHLRGVEDVGDGVGDVVGDIHERSE